MKVNIKGLYDKQIDIVNSIFNSDASFHILNASRQCGKSFSVSHLLMALSLYEANEGAIIVAPSYSQTKVIFDTIIQKQGFRQFIKSSKASAPFEIITTTGFKMAFRSAERPDHIRSGSFKYIVADEFAFWKNDEDGKSMLMNVLFPMTSTKKNAKVIILSTPNGVYNEFHDFYQKSLAEPDVYKYYTLHYSEKPERLKNDKAIELARASMPIRMFEQEYELRFIDSGGEVFENVKAVSILDAYQPSVNGSKYYAGIDFGSVGDSTVLTILNQNKETVSISFHSGDYVIQINEMAFILNQYKPITYAESNSMGLPVINMLKTKYANVHMFNTNNSSKKEIIEGLKLDIYTNNIKLPTPKLCPTLNKELNNYTFSQTKTGLISYHHRTGEHDDTVMSLAIANYAYTNHNKGAFLRTSANSFYN